MDELQNENIPLMIDSKSGKLNLGIQGTRETYQIMVQRYSPSSVL